MFVIGKCVCSHGKLWQPGGLLLREAIKGLAGVFGRQIFEHISAPSDAWTKGGDHHSSKSVPSQHQHVCASRAAVAFCCKSHSTGLRGALTSSKGWLG